MRILFAGLLIFFPEQIRAAENQRAQNGVNDIRRRAPCLPAAALMFCVIRPAVGGGVKDVMGRFAHVFHVGSGALVRDLIRAARKRGDRKKCGYFRRYKGGGIREWQAARRQRPDKEGR